MLSLKIKKKKENGIEKGETVFKLKYERINFAKFFRNNGYVKKILYVYNEEVDGVYYNNKEKREIPCCDGEVFITSHSSYEEKKSIYNLVRVDFSIPKKLCVLMSSNDKTDLFECIKREKLVEIKEKNELEYKDILGGYEEIFLEILDELIKKDEEKNKTYNQDEIVELIVDNTNLSTEIKKYSEDEELRMTLKIRIKNRAKLFTEHIFEQIMNFKINKAEEFKNYISLKQFQNVVKEYLAVE